SCFSGCIKWSKVELPESLTTMGKHVLHNATI
ncbi:Hypothetical protein EIN_494430, partial [Entamoeba invadens IP1]